MAFWETQSLIIWWRVKRVTPEITGREARCLPVTTWAPHLTTEATQQIRFHKHILGSLSSDVFEPRTSSGSGLFALLNRQFEQMFGQILSIRVKLRSNAIFVPWRYIKRGTGSLPVRYVVQERHCLNSIFWTIFHSCRLLNAKQRNGQEWHDLYNMKKFRLCVTCISQNIIYANVNQ